MNTQKLVFKKILVVGAIVMSILPLLVTFSSFLTDLFDKMGWYTLLQTTIAPYESRLVAVIIKLFGIPAEIALNQKYSLILIRGNDSIPVALEWNCLGWQSMVLLFITFLTGLKKEYTFSSKLQTILFGVLGTFLSNLLRMALIVIIIYYANNLAARIIHDYFAAFIALIWMICFWWFSYSFILETKEDKMRMENDSDIIK